MPPRQGPPSRINSIRPPNCRSTSCAVMGLSCPEMLALVTASTPPASRMSARASGKSGTRTATVGLGLIASGTAVVLGSTNVSPPGQKRAINFLT